MSDEYIQHQNFPYFPRYEYLDEEEDHSSIYCITYPTGADIYLDGVLQSQHTNSTLTNISPGNHTITFVLSGYISYTQTVNVIKGKTVTVSATLVPNVGNIYCVTSPTGADIYLDGVLQSQHTNSTLTNISPGNHTITFAKTGYISYTQTVNVVGGQTVTVSAILQIITYGNLSIVTDPSDAYIYIDGLLQTQKTSSTITNITTGQHTVMLTKAGYSSNTQTVNIIANQTISICAILQQLSTITDTEIVGCTASAVSSCPLAPIPYTIISPLDYVNLMAIINSTQTIPVTVRFIYTINDITNYTDATTNLVIGTNVVYAFPTNRTYPGGTVLTISDAILI